MRQMSICFKFSPKHDSNSSNIVVWRYGMMRIVGYCAAVFIILIHSAITWYFANVCVVHDEKNIIYIYEDYPMHPSFFCDMSCLTFKCPASFFLRRKAPKLRIAPHVTGQQFESNFSDRRWQNMWPFFFECPKTWTWTEHWFSVFEGALQAFIRFLTTCELGFCSILKNR